MMEAKLDNELHALLLGRMERLGFKAANAVCFVRPIAERKQLITLTTRNERGKLKFSCALGVRFESIESMLRPDNNSDTYPTISCPIHLLRPERTFYEWEGSDTQSVTVAADSVIQEIVEVESEFFDRFSTLERVKHELMGSDFLKYCVLSVHQRIGILAAISLLKGQRSEAEELLVKAAHDPKNQNRGTLRRLDELRRQLVGSNNSVEG